MRQDYAAAAAVARATCDRLQARPTGCARRGLRALALGGGAALGWRLVVGPGGDVGLGRLRRHVLDLVLAHVVVHLAPAGEDGGLVGALVETIAIFDRAAGVAAGAADGLAFGFLVRCDGAGRLETEQVAARQP